MFRRSLQIAQTVVACGSRSVSTSVRRSSERSVNRIHLLGRVGSDPKKHGTERTLVSFPLATSHTFRVTNEDGSVTEKSRTQWHLINVKFPGTQQYVLNYVGRGCRVYVTGRLEYGRSQKEDGTTRELAVIATDELILLSTPASAKSATGKEDQDQEQFRELDTTDDIV